VDEVFAEYGYREDPARLLTSAGTREALTFTLSGLSKMAGLPQVKLSWIAAGGPAKALREALARLEIICDTFLSVNTPVQHALPELMRAGTRVKTAILRRAKANYAFLKAASEGTPCTVLESEGGWYALLRVPRTRTDERWALELLEERGVYLYPGYFFDFEEEGILVVSLLVEEEGFQKAARKLLGYIGSTSDGLTRSAPG
jgi:alanine-synthesizing transaminase